MVKRYSAKYNKPHEEESGGVKIFTIKICQVGNGFCRTVRLLRKIFKTVKNHMKGAWPWVCWNDVHGAPSSRNETFIPVCRKWFFLNKPGLILLGLDPSAGNSGKQDRAKKNKDKPVGVLFSYRDALSINCRSPVFMISTFGFVPLFQKGGEDLAITAIL